MRTREGRLVIDDLRSGADSQFWLDPRDRHHMPSAIQFLTRPREYWGASADPRHLLVLRERVWAKAVHRVAAEGWRAEQAADKAIARIKGILSE
jgi:multiple sugar transport system substrate-binding protein